MWHNRLVSFSEVYKKCFHGNCDAITWWDVILMKLIRVVLYTCVVFEWLSVYDLFMRILWFGCFALQPRIELGACFVYWLNYT